MIYFSFKTTIYTIDFITALLTFVCLSYLFYLMFIKLQNPNVLFYEENFKKKYGHFYADLKLISFLTRNFKFFLLGQKMLVTFFLISLHSYPIANLIIFSFMGTWLLIVFIYNLSSFSTGGIYFY